MPAIERTYPTARFQVLESFVGAEPGEFEVRMTSDVFLGGIPQQVPAFVEGEIWLVEAYRDLRDQQWTTSSCQRTKPGALAQSTEGRHPEARPRYFRALRRSRHRIYTC